MGLYMMEVLGLPENEVLQLRKTYFQTYGTTLRGLQLHHNVDVDEYLKFVHDLPLEKYIHHDPVVVRTIAGLPQRRFIFTNADADHASRVLKILQLEDYFDGIIDIRAIEFACKPDLAAYKRALSLAGHPDPQACLMLDDSAANLYPAKELGFTTVLVSMSGSVDPLVHHTIEHIKDLPLALPELWDGYPMARNRERI